MTKPSFIGDINLSGWRLDASDNFAESMREAVIAGVAEAYQHILESGTSEIIMTGDAESPLMVSVLIPLHDNDDLDLWFKVNLSNAVEEYIDGDVFGNARDADYLTAMVAEFRRLADVIEARMTAS